MTELILKPEQFQSLIDLVEKSYPDWQGFSDPRFVAGEVTYKQKAVAKAGELINEAALNELIAQGNFEEFKDRLEKVAQKAYNLLYLSAPRTADLGVLYQEGLDQIAFMEAFVELIYGPGSSVERLAKYSAYLQENGYLNKWAFPTFFLFVCHPESEMFVKPRTTQWFLRFVGVLDTLPACPEPEIYDHLLSLCRQLWDALQPYLPHNFVDVQGFIWTAYSASQPAKKLSKPFNKMFKDWSEAQWAFDLLQTAMKNLGVDRPDHPLLGVTCRNHSGGQMIRLSYGMWLMMGINGKAKSVTSIHIALLKNRIALDSIYAGDFSQPAGKPQITLYEFPVAVFKQNESEIMEVFAESVQVILEQFSDWRGAPHHRHNNNALAEAILQEEARERVFPNGLTIDTEPVVPTIEEIIQIPQVLDMRAETPVQPIYSLEQCSEETGIGLKELQRWLQAIDRKKQVILYGPPGTGKTFIAEKLARHLIGGGDGFYKLVQFHPEVTYEEFIQGIRPKSFPDGGLHYPVVPGRFLEFCEEARSREDPCVLIIDEINRANLARVFGELMYLLEYRERVVELSAGNNFRIPESVYIIGTMNTADRSIALVDHALRRRFAMLALYPNYDILRKYHERENTGFPVEGLIKVLEDLNISIADRHYAIGPSYFLRKDLSKQIESIWQMEVEPYLEEYFFDQSDKYLKFCWAHISNRIIAG